ncbi:hypothetical protein CU098_012277 [Rhizopus stolonifer]|uniref:Transmembrane protein n=1 Tax=Rhizopus stolonifer TaxID=4846 RepID=A0A367KRG3_RHIST|nr:hypothetical protein CU098_012277 [Rhizopus stolonifer]
MNTNNKKQTSNASDVDEQPPPPYQETENSSTSSLYPQPPPTQPVYHHPPPRHNQPRYQAVQIPLPVQTRQNRRQFPLAAIFFLFGWFCPPLWILGACCCAGSRNDYEAWWGKVNFVMSVLLIVSSIFFSIFTMSRY